MNHTATSRRESIVTSALLASVCLLALPAAVLGWASWLEAFSFITGAICVWLTVQRSIWNFPVGLANVTAYAVVFFQAGLFADAGLQLVYFALGLSGWCLWLRDGDHGSDFEVRRAGKLELGLLAVLVAVSTVGLWQALRGVGGVVSFWDALTTSISLAAQWLLNRKRLESWVGWIVVDIIYVPLYVYKELYLTALLYFLFLIMAILGLRVWRQTWLARRAYRPDEATVEVEAQ